MSSEENKDLIRRYIQAIDENQTSDWRVLDEYIAKDFIAHNPLYPGVSLDREGMKHGRRSFASLRLGKATRSNPSGGGRPCVVATLWAEACRQESCSEFPQRTGACDRRHCDPSRSGRQDR